MVSTSVLSCDSYASHHIVVGNLLGHAASAGSNSGPQSALIDPDLCTLVPHLKVGVNGP